MELKKLKIWTSVCMVVFVGLIIYAHTGERLWMSLLYDLAVWPLYVAVPVLFIKLLVMKEEDEES